LAGWHESGGCSRCEEHKFEFKSKLMREREREPPSGSPYPWATVMCPRKIRDTLMRSVANTNKGSNELPDRKKRGGYPKQPRRKTPDGSTNSQEETKRGGS
jgi:hypothetical protein